MLAQLTRFGAVGVLATVAHVLAALAAGNLFPLTAQEANLVGFASAVTLSYLGHARFTFGARVGSAIQALRFAALSLFGLGASSLTVWIMTSLLGFGLVPAMAAVGIAVPTASYVGMRFWVFATTEKSPP